MGQSLCVQYYLTILCVQTVSVLCLLWSHLSELWTELESGFLQFANPFWLELNPVGKLYVISNKAPKVVPAKLGQHRSLLYSHVPFGCGKFWHILKAVDIWLLWICCFWCCNTYINRLWAKFLLGGWLYVVDPFCLLWDFHRLFLFFRINNYNDRFEFVRGL